MSGGWGTPSWMGGEPEVGETFVQGRDRDTARALLAAARELDLDTLVVRTTGHGFIVPNEVWDKAQQMHQTDSSTDF